MKTPYIFRLLFAFLLPLALLVSSCGDKEKKNDPQPPASRIVQVRIAGQSIAGLGARIVANATSPQGVVTNYLDEDVPGPDVDETKASFPVPAGNDFNLTITFSNVRNGNRAPVAAVFGAQIISDGKVLRTIQIDKTTASTSTGASASTVIPNSEWQ